MGNEGGVKMKKLVVLLAIFPLLFCKETSKGNPYKAQLIKGPYVRHITSSSATIMWETDISTDSVLNYSETKGGWWSAGTKSVKEILINGIPANINRGEITSLTPDKTYYYKVVSLKEPTEIYSFKTAPSSSGAFRFIAYGDTRGTVAGEQVNHKTIVDAITKIDPQPLLILNTGDIVNSGIYITSPGSIGPNEWQLFFDTIQPLVNHIAYYIGVGNHDYSGSGEDKFKVFAAYFPFEGNKETYYSFDIGVVHFIVLNSETDFGIGSTQHTWLKNDLASAVQGSKFTIAAFHRPPYSSSGHGSDLETREAFSTLFEQYKVDLVINGHNHAYERSCPVITVACDNTNGVIYIVAGAGGAPLYGCDEEPLPPGIIQYCKKEHLFTILDVSCDPDCSIKGSTLNAGLTEVDSFTITSRR